MRVDLGTYLTEALEIIQRQALYADRVDWAQTTRECRELCADARTTADCYPALRRGLAALGDGHSFLRLPGAGTVHSGIIGLYFIRGVIAIVLPGSPAARAGLRLGDRILKIQGQAVGSEVNEGLVSDPVLTTEVEQGGQPLTLRLERENTAVVPSQPTGKLIAPGIGLLTLPDCDLDGLLADGTAYQDCVSALLLGLAVQGAVRWIVDLRLNHGGNMWPMLAGIGPLAGHGELGAFVRGEERWFWSYAAGEASIDGEVLSRVQSEVMAPLLEDAPVAVLISQLTASSGEILTLSFVGRSGTRLFGEPTRGLTTSNSLYELSDGAALLITSAIDADRTGQLYDGPITPDVDIPTDWAEFQTAADPVLAAALDWLETA